MPKQVLPTLDGFWSFRRALMDLEFRPISHVEFRKQFQRLDLRAPRPRLGRETGFVFSANNLDVVVWTTWLSREGKAREEDAGWVLIKERDAVHYFSHPIHRTGNFFPTLFRHAWIARWRVLNRPLCPECKAYMNVARGRGIKSRYWSCSRALRHGMEGTIRLDWDHGMPPRAKALLTLWRKARARYRERRREEGKATDVAILRRKRWRVSRNAV